MATVKLYAKNNRISYVKEDLDNITDTCTFTVKSEPSEGATIRIDGTETDVKIVDYGTTVNYEVSKNGFNTETGNLKICRDTELNVEMVGSEEELDWIKLTGEQYISNIQHTIPANSSLETKISYIKEENSTVFLGRNSVSNNNYISLGVLSSLGKISLAVRKPSSSSEKNIYSSNYSVSVSSTPIIIKYNNLSVYKDNNNVTMSREITTNDLYALDNYDLLRNNYTKFPNKFYWLKIYNGNTDEVIHHYVPVLADDVVKMKDLITNEIISFSGTNISGITYGRKSS